MASGAKFDDTVFQQRAAALARNLGKDEFEFVKQQTGLLAREVARHTPPFAVFPSGGGTSLGTRADKVQGEWAVYIDVKWICTIKSAAEIAEAKTLPAPPDPEVTRMEFDMKDKLVRQTIMSTQEDVKEIKKDLDNIERKIDELK